MIKLALRSAGSRPLVPISGAGDRDSIHPLRRHPFCIHLKRLRPIGFICLIFTGVCAAQIPSETDVTSTPVPNAGHDYIHALGETVNPANGSLSIRINVPLPPSRGLTLPFSFAYDSNGAYYFNTPCQGECSGFDWWTTNTMLSAGGWSYTVPMLSVESDSFTVETLSPLEVPGTFTCQGRINYVMQDPSGNRRNLGLTYYNPNTNCQNPDLGGIATTVTNASIGSLMSQTTASWGGAANNSPGIVNPLTVTDGDGTTYSFTRGPAPPLAFGCGTNCQPTTYPPSSVTDRNGNTYGIAYSTASHGAPAITYTDSIGRAALSIPTFGANPDSITVSGFTAPYKVSWTPVQANFSVTLTPAATGANEACAPPGPQPAVQAVSAIVLPNGQQFTFDYISNIYGMVDKITYPSGGYVRYVWGLNPQAEYGQWPIYSSMAVGYGDNVTYVPYISGTCAYYYDTPAILHRYVSFDGAHEVLQQDFSYSTTWGGSGYSGSQWSQKQTTVVTHDLARGTQFSTAYTYSPTSADYQPSARGEIPPQIPVESQVQYYDTNGTLLKTVTKWWGNERIITQQKTTLNPNLVSQTNLTYNPNEMVTEKDDSDYGSGMVGSVLRKTIFCYHSLIPLNTCNNTLNNFTGHIVDKPDYVQVQTAGSTGLAQVTYSYDSVGDLLTHTDWVTAGGAAALTTSHTYDAYGNIVSTTDPKDNVTTYAYAANPFVDTCTFTSPASAYLTNITYPAVNGVVHQENFQYNCATGNLATSSDENSQVTTYKYNTPPSNCSAPDGLDRLSEIDYPDGGKKTFCYFDGTYNNSASNPIPNVTTSVLMVASNTWKTSVSAADGIGHQVWNEVTSDPQGTSYVNTVYDGEDNVWEVSNPSYSASGLAYTSYTYDAVKRKTAQTNTDGTARQWCYNGLADQGQSTCSANKGTKSTLAAYPWVDSSDENGSHWQQISDGLGRLVAAIEPNSSNVPALETDYQYDVLGNLLQVDQWGGAYGSTGDRQRVFSYDGLSRLQMSSNPESGMTSYSYAVSGGLCAGDPSLPCSRTDARGVITNYTYDALNRLTAKSYSVLTSTSSTPSACFQYDISPFASSANLSGRLTNEWTQSSSAGACGAAPPTSGKLTLRSILAYDPMGRITSEQQCTPSGCTGGTPYALSYQYDLAGDLTYSTNGISTTPGTSTPLSFTRLYNGAGRLQTVTSSNWTNSATHPTTLFSAQSGSGACGSTLAYAAFGGLQNAVYGNGLALNRNYDLRLRPSCETDTGQLVVNATPGTAIVTITGAEQSN
jgi:YD repeat-containing protein